MFFDLYGTLAGFDPPREQIQARAAAEHGITVGPAGITAGYRDADEFMARQNAHAPLRTMASDERDRFFARYEQLVLRGAGHDVDLAEAARVWKSVQRQQYGLALFPEALPTLGALRTEGLTLGVVSNMNEKGETVARRLGLTGHVDFVVTSIEAGAEKPHLPIFREALSRAAVGADEAVHVGDQLDSDVEGARRAGIRPVLIDRYGNHGEHTGSPRIASLEELSDLISLLNNDH